MCVKLLCVCVCVCVCVCFCVLCRRLSCLPLSQPPSLTLPSLSLSAPPRHRRTLPGAPIIAAAKVEMEDEETPAKIPLEIIVEGGFGRTPSVVAAIEKAVRAAVAEVNNGLSLGGSGEDVVLLDVAHPTESLLCRAPMGTDPSATAACGAALQAAIDAATLELVAVEGHTVVAASADAAAGSTAARSIAVTLAPGGPLCLVARQVVTVSAPEEDEEEVERVRTEVILRRWTALPAEVQSTFEFAVAEGGDAAAVTEGLAVELLIVEIERAAAPLESLLTRAVEIGSDDPDEAPEARVVARMSLTLPSGVAFDALCIKATTRVSPAGVLQVEAWVVARDAEVEGAAQATVEVKPSAEVEDYWWYDAEHDDADDDEDDDGIDGMDDDDMEDLEEEEEEDVGDID